MSQLKKQLLDPCVGREILSCPLRMSIVKCWPTLWNNCKGGLTTYFKATHIIATISRINVQCPSLHEIEIAIGKKNVGIVAGIDGIMADMLKADSKVVAQIIYSLFKNIWINEKFPGERKHNWRGIMLLCAPMKILRHIILDRISLGSTPLFTINRRD